MAQPTFTVLGTSAFTLTCCDGLIAGGGKVSTLINLVPALLPDNSVSIGDAARKRGIAYAEVSDINDTQGHATLMSADSSYIFSTWPRLLSPGTLNLARQFVIGTHPTPLPHNRGRHPLQWMISMGYDETILSFFRMDKGVDSGEILHRVPFSISGLDIAMAADRMDKAGYEGAAYLATLLTTTPNPRGESQNHQDANSWRKRTPHDVILDPRMTVSMAVRTVRSFSPPYPCAKLIYGSKILDVVAAEEFKGAVDKNLVRRLEPGRIVASGENWLAMKVDDGIVNLRFAIPLSEAIHAAKIIHPPTRYALEHGDAIASLLGLGHGDPSR